jgi:hypothetical protein
MSVCVCVGGLGVGVGMWHVRVKVLHHPAFHSPRDKLLLLAVAGACSHQSLAPCNMQLDAVYSAD